MTKEQLKEKAAFIAAGQVLCNREELMEKMTALDIFNDLEELEETDQLVIWEPMEHEPIETIREIMDGIISSVESAFEDMVIPEPEIPCEAMSGVSNIP